MFTILILICSMIANAYLLIKIYGFPNHVFFSDETIESWLIEFIVFWLYSDQHRLSNQFRIAYYLQRSMNDLFQCIGWSIVYASEMKQPSESDEAQLTHQQISLKLFNKHNKAVICFARGSSSPTNRITGRSLRKPFICLMYDDESKSLKQMDQLIHRLITNRVSKGYTILSSITKSKPTLQKTSQNSLSFSKTFPHPQSSSSYIV